MDLAPEIPYPYPPQPPPVNTWTDRRLWKRYIPATTVVGGKNVRCIRTFNIAVNDFDVKKICSCSQVFVTISTQSDIILKTFLRISFTPFVSHPLKTHFSIIHVGLSGLACISVYFPERQFWMLSGETHQLILSPDAVKLSNIDPLLAPPV